MCLNFNVAHGFHVTFSGFVSSLGLVTLKVPSTVQI